MYEATTREISVSVTPQYLAEQSSPEKAQYFWAYTIVIKNLGGETVQLKTRYWHITDGVGKVEEVRGPGVVGETPVIHPGDSYSYTSGCPLSTPSGIMRGSYGMIGPDGVAFDIAIPAFSLDSPNARRTLN
ncbi:MAG TPA: Co2+/Mg2+ efflux protein ApaG [Hyphomicrobiaceae bacterium]|nr:Co2+/Mg2+ efflux protein ApaG [Hyphomicrobiaceae bacterium]